MRNCGCLDLKKQNLLKRINEVSFAADDMELFLDTHPECQEAISYFKSATEERKDLLEEYARSYGALNMDTFGSQTCDVWKWVEEPFPWE